MQDLLNRQRLYFETRATQPVAFRKEQLKKLKESIQTNEGEIYEALEMDLGKPIFESFATEISLVMAEIDHALKHLKHWMKSKRVRGIAPAFPSSNKVVPEPLGSTLVIGTWNYPFMLTLSPMVASMAAGNTVVIKPSEHSPYTSRLIKKMLSETFDDCYIAVAEGGTEVSSTLTALPFDHIFFTGSTRVGRMVMQAAANNLVPVTLELGGKSPCIVHNDTDIEVAARRIAWGKVVNAGQSCVAPDYAYVHKDIYEPFVEQLIKNFEGFYKCGPHCSCDYTHIVNRSQFDRLVNLMQNVRVRYGGNANEHNLCISPAIIENVSREDAIMQEEIFGPLLPLIPYTDADEVVRDIRQNEKPLACYIFTRSKKMAAYFEERLSFGSGCINDTMIQFGNPHLPIGGVGKSGMGRYHGEDGFRTFSNFKSITTKGFWPDFEIRYPPYQGKLKWIRAAFKL